jgi:NAD(P)-dependent dehydrogenase (short-subunit alcohol dehydrogenase family)
VKIMRIPGSVALVTGANRGLGERFVRQLLDRGAAKVYAAARTPGKVDIPGATPVRLDVTDPASIEEAAAAAPDVTLLINNAGISTHTPLITGDLEKIRLEIETGYFGPLNVTRAFAPVMAKNGGGAVLNVLSILSWVHRPHYGAYSSAKAAAWAMTNVIRQELVPQGIDVTGLHVGYLDTDMAAYVDPSDKTDPAVVAALALDGIEARAAEVIVGDNTRMVKAALAGEIKQLYPDVATVG